MAKFIVIFFLVNILNLDSNTEKTSKEQNQIEKVYSYKKPRLNRKPVSIAKNHMFIVSHNKSPNVVVYQANINVDGYLDTKKPIDVFWLFNKGEITEELNLLEWKLAFGFKLTTIIKGKKYKIKLNAFKNKIITVVKEKNNRVKSYISINGKTTLLKKVFFNYENSYYLPQVKYLIFKGIDIKSGKYITEKLIVNK